MDPDRSNLKTLVVDDDVMMRQVLSRILIKDGYEIDVADGSQSAMSKLTNAEFDLLITDIVMSDGTGVELVERVRMLYPDILIIVVATYSDIDAAVRAMRLGASGFVLKPFRMDEIRMALRSAIDNRQNQEERSRLRILTQLVDAGKEIASSLDVAKLAERVVQYAMQVTNADTASLMLVDPDTEELFMAAQIGLDDPFQNGYRKPIHEGIAGWALQRCFALNLRNDRLITPELGHLMRLDGKVLSSICMPILTEGQPLGVLNVNRLVSSRKRAFDSSDMDFLSILTSQAAVCIRNSELFMQVQKLYIGSIQALSSALQAKDTYTGGHSEKVAYFAKTIAERMGMSLTEQRELWTAGILHDIGKIGTPEEILNKTTLLSSDEWEIIRNHPTTGAEIVSSVPELKQIAPIIRAHHEWFDGSGYPEGLSRESIPIGARILSVADALEAMTADRPYRKNRSVDRVRSELVSCSGTQFDPDVVRYVIALIDDHALTIGHIQKETSPI